MQHYFYFFCSCQITQLHAQNSIFHSWREMITLQTGNVHAIDLAASIMHVQMLAY